MAQAISRDWVMTRLREVIHHQETLADIREIMNAMKNLAIIESRKLDKVLASQRVIVKDLDTLAADFTDHHPFTFPVNEQYHLYILIGAERGFSGSFTHQLQQRYRGLVQDATGTSPLVIAIGRKFATTFSDSDASPSPVFLDGASAQEEISHILIQLVTEIESMQEQYGALACTVVRHEQLTHDIRVQPLLPPFQARPPNHQPEGFAPLLYLEPAQFLSDLIEQYLFAHLFSALNASLLAENEFRVAHLEGAIRHLDERCVELARQRRSLRQEEIIEEIEVILLNAGQGDLVSGKTEDEQDT
ncbi:MAG: F0F1 ATP synthase subunit gamma [Gammaproteobacteria bacterium]